MKKKEYHPRIKALMVRNSSMNYSQPMTVNSAGELDAGELAKGAVADDTADVNVPEVKFDPENNIIKGYAAVWGVVDDYGTVFVKGCFAKSIQERGPDSRSNYKITGVYYHDLRDPIGRVTKLVEDEHGLYFEITLDDFEAVPQAKRVAAQVQSGTINQFSFGFDYIWDKMEYDQNTDAVLVNECELWEISPVTMGSNIQTEAIRGKQDWEDRKIILDEEIEEFIKSIPRPKQLEAKQLFARQTSLINLKPVELRQEITSEEDKPEETGNKDQFNISEILKTVFQ